MKIGILYICTGKYKIFWKDFYLSCEKSFINEAEKHYFVFTDSPEIEFEKENKNITRIYQENLGWPNNTLLRYEMFLKIKERIQTHDYLIFFNANLLFLENIIAGEFLPKNTEKLIGAIHPGFYKNKVEEFPYERNQLSKASVDNGMGKYYYQGAINGGETQYFIKTIEIIDKNIKNDLKKGIIAKWHDESHWNWYLNNHLDVVKTLSPSYLYPEGSSLPYEAKILIRGKNKYFGGLNQIRNLKNTISKNYILGILKRIKDKIIYSLFEVYDNIFCSYYFIIKAIRNNKRTDDTRKISVAITSYNRDYIIHKSLKNIVNDDRIDEIVILDDGSDNKSFEKTKEKIGVVSKKIQLYRREKNLGVLTTKIQSLNLCKNDWVILLDSDNTINTDFLDELYKIKDWDYKTIYSPSFPAPLLDFKEISGIKIDFKRVKELLIRKTKVTENLLNDGNFFFNKNSFMKLMKKYEFFNPKASDIIFINYIWLSNKGEIFVLPGASYIHRIHKMSTWKENSVQSAIFFEEIKNKILMDHKEVYSELREEIPTPEEKDYKIVKI